MRVYTVTIMDEDAALEASCALVTLDYKEARNYAHDYVRDTLIAGAEILVVADDRNWLLQYPEQDGEARLCSVKVEEHYL